MDLSGFGAFFHQLDATVLAPWRPALEGAVRERLEHCAHGDMPRWDAALAVLPAVGRGALSLDCPAVGFSPETPLTAEDRNRLREALLALHPWRKGPYALCGVEIDTEWRSDWKWDRLAPAIAPLTDRLVLDVGCGNGYYAWRMLGAGARLVLGIDPTQVFVAQFLAVNHFAHSDRLAALPLRIEDLPAGMSGFDTVFSMGVLSHRRVPLEHLDHLLRLLRPGGELVLETLVLDASSEQALVPEGRYAGMRNVWCLPTPATLTAWLTQRGFCDVRLVDVSPTTVREQRTSDWMRFWSLAEQLDPTDPRRTVEGHPAPVRALLLARRPDG